MDRGRHKKSENESDGKLHNPDLPFDDIMRHHVVGRGGALVEAITFNRRVVGSTPALAAT